MHSISVTGVEWHEGVVSHRHPFFDALCARQKLVRFIGIGGITIVYLVRFESTEKGQLLADNPRLIVKGAKLPAEVDGEVTQTIALRCTRLTIGRAKDRDLVLQAVRISRRHAVLDFEGGSYFLSDAQSRLGTYVNGKSIIRARLDPGDRIQMGTYLFRFEGERIRGSGTRGQGLRSGGSHR